MSKHLAVPTIDIGPFLGGEARALDRRHLGEGPGLAAAAPTVGAPYSLSLGREDRD